MNTPPPKDCPLKSKTCNNWTFLYNSEFNNYNLPIYQCETCHLQRVYPIPNDVNEYYNEDYYKGKAKYSYIDEREKFFHHSYVWKSRLSIIQREYKKKFQNFPNNRPFRILEVGSSFGGFLRIAQSKSWEVLGVEISEYAAKYSQDFGVPTIHSTLENGNLPGNYFDVVVLSEVIEHIPNASQCFDILHRILADKGILVLQTANFEGWQAKNEGSEYHYYLPGHLFYYSESNLKAILSTRGNYSFRSFYGSDVSLISKLRKMSGGFTSILDYIKWIKTSLYHWKSKWKHKGFPLTSGFVLYAFKGGNALESEE